MHVCFIHGYVGILTCTEEISTGYTPAVQADILATATGTPTAFSIALIPAGLLLQHRLPAACLLPCSRSCFDHDVVLVHTQYFAGFQDCHTTGNCAEKPKKKKSLVLQKVWLVLFFFFSPRTTLCAYESPQVWINS